MSGTTELDRLKGAVERRARQSPRVRLAQHGGYARVLGASLVGEALHSRKIATDQSAIENSLVDRQTGLSSKRILELAGAQGNAAQFAEVVAVLSVLGYELSVVPLDHQLEARA